MHIRVKLFSREQMTVLKMCSVVNVVSIAVCEFYHHWLAVAIA